ncbi:hypothetical protein AB0H29_00100 [Streptomyces thermolilacinus]
MTAPSRPALPDGRIAAGVARLAIRHQGRFSAETAQRLIAVVRNSREALDCRVAALPDTLPGA